MKIEEKIVLIIVFAYSILHLLIILKMIPFNIVWGGKIESIYTIYVLEGLALVIMVFLGAVIAMKNRITKPILEDRTIKKILLVFAVFFMLNTIGNLLAKTIVEKAQAVITLFLAITLFKSSIQVESL